MIGRDGKTVVIKHGGLLRNMTKIHITRIQGLQGERLYGNEEGNGESKLFQS